MKKVLFMLAMILPMFILPSCSKDDEPNIDGQLVGIWEEDTNSEWEVFCIELKEDGTGCQWAEDYGEIDEYGKSYFAWSTSGGKITVIHENDGSMTMNYAIRNGKLYVSYEDETITYVKK